MVLQWLRTLQFISKIILENIKANFFSFSQQLSSQKLLYTLYMYIKRRRELEMMSKLWANNYKFKSDFLKLEDKA